MHLRIGSQLLINIFDFVSFSFGTHRQRFLFCCIHTLESALFKGLRSCLLLIVWLLDRQRGWMRCRLGPLDLIQAFSQLIVSILLGLSCRQFLRRQAFILHQNCLSGNSAGFFWPLDPAWKMGCSDFIVYLILYAFLFCFFVLSYIFSLVIVDVDLLHFILLGLRPGVYPHQSWRYGIICLARFVCRRSQFRRGCSTFSEDELISLLIVQIRNDIVAVLDSLQVDQSLPFGSLVHFLDLWVLCSQGWWVAKHFRSQVVALSKIYSPFLFD